MDRSNKDQVWNCRQQHSIDQEGYNKHQEADKSCWDCGIGIVDAAGAVDFIRLPKDHEEQITQEKLKYNTITTQLDNPIAGKPVTINKLELYGHNSLMEKVRNYAADTVPIMGRRCFKAMDNTAIEAAIGFQMGNIDDINLRDRNERYLADETTEINLKLPIPDGKFTMLMGWMSTARTML